MKIFCPLIAIIFSYFALAAHATSSISYTDVGEGKPLILIHAFPTDERLWEPQRDGLKKYFRVITLDLYGFGKANSANGQAITMEEYAEQVKQLFDRLHIQKAIVGGESMGGYIALAFLEKYPNNTMGLILSDTQAIADSDEVKARREATAIDILQHGSAQFIAGFMPKALTVQASEQMRQSLLQIMEAQSSAAMASALRGMAVRSDKSDVLANTSLPILIMTGEQDVLISPQQSYNMHALAKNSKLILLANAAHLSSLEQSAQWNQAIISMFGS